MRNSKYVLRSKEHIYSLLWSYPAFFSTIHHFCGETYLGKHCSNSLKATVSALRRAIGGHLWSVDSEGWKTKWVYSQLKWWKWQLLKLLVTIFCSERRERILAPGAKEDVLPSYESQSFVLQSVAAPTQFGRGQVLHGALFLVLNFKAKSHLEQSTQ